MTPDWREARRILCVCLDTLAGVLLCTPAMRVLRDALPGRSLTLLTSPAGAAAAPFLPVVHDTIAHAAPWVAAHGPSTPSAPSSLSAPAGMLKLTALLAARRFDAAVVFTPSSQSALPAALLCWLAGIPLRLAHCREHPHHLLTHWIPDPESQVPVRHAVQRQLDLVRHAGATAAGTATAAPGLSFALRAADLASVRARLLRMGVDAGRRWLLLHPGAGAASRRYPPGQWARVLDLLAQRTGLPLVLTGSADETGLVEDIRAAAGTAAHSLAGQLGLGELGAALRLAAVALSGNSAPAHLAAAVGTPVVNLYALTSPQHTPWKVRSRVLFHDVPCRFCFADTCPTGHHGCLAGVTPERVVDAVLDLLPPHPAAADIDADADAADADASAG